MDTFTDIKELKPKNGRKSFYGTAYVMTDTYGYKILRSYDTDIIAMAPDGSLVPIAHPDKISKTTATHLNSFCQLHKRDYVKLYNQRNGNISNR